jgi:hypothetical protein
LLRSGGVSREHAHGLRELAESLCVSRQTLLRWLDWFKAVFPTSSAWQRLRGRIDASVHNDSLPSELLNRFLAIGKDPFGAVIDCLHFLASGDKPSIQHDK